MAKNVREAALEIVEQINKNQAYSNILLNRTIEKYNLNRKDIGLLTEIVYGTIQRKRTIDFFLDAFLKNKKKIETWVYSLLELSVYQMVYLDRVPDRAVIHEAVEIAKKKGHKGISGFVNGVLRSVQRKGVPSFSTIKDTAEKIAVEYSHPTWLVKRWIAQYGEEETINICKINLEPPQVTARVNTAKTSVGEVMAHLEEEGLTVERGDLSIDGIKIIDGYLPGTRAFKNGLVTIQDESSMLVARGLDIEPGMSVLDACAAPGGKTTHIAELMKNEGQVYSLDLHKHKVKLIKDQVKRLGLTNVETAALDSRKAGGFFQGTRFDRILVDAPCTGYGVIRRKPDIKWSKQEKDAEAISAVQKEILQTVSTLLKPGGKLLYSTCTIEEAENQRVIEAFLKENPEFTQDRTLIERLPEKLGHFVGNDDGQVQILPHYFGTDGFYIACLTKKGEN
ncbi:16S rRNA (cytosine(967)-C(5))-methyltransferase RsmB [Pseudalkalibacillus caeni]|uniref:16S rRNA (cytosine(967)-C(5))-methyltransferase n=1 Tax=Exobacillus caeni TaxID=2574798 RepID=A0A5R9F6R9_9BACL|nr:16S rRNA (cytosine(967)-C(5))-methyltransferase RsmB [Pseudalkalibacillus caeni]TLS37318.1 16S rRNA (cytosine(967)-C(5))-methyltransferase RsmB [Pseudalkalibacillus caeni]